MLMRKSRCSQPTHRRRRKIWKFSWSHSDGSRSRAPFVYRSRCSLSSSSLAVRSVRNFFVLRTLSRPRKIL